MPVQIDSRRLQGGVLLQRLWSSDIIDSVDIQCGPATYYDSMIANMRKNSLEYYDAADGTNKFLKHVTLKVHAHPLPYADSPAGTDPYAETFWCINEGNGNSHVDLRYLDPAAGNSYRYPASISHEFGHAYHYWCGWPLDSNWGQEVSRFWQREVATNHNLVAQGGAPWGPGWNEFEAFANAWRCLKGVQETRGIPDVPAGMESANNHPEWRKQFDLMPELCAFMKTYGCIADSLSWRGDATNGYWMFRRATDGVWVAQTAYYSWQQYVKANWYTSEAWSFYSPQYTLV